MPHKKDKFSKGGNADSKRPGHVEEVEPLKEVIGKRLERNMANKSLLESRLAKWMALPSSFVVGKPGSEEYRKSLQQHTDAKLEEERRENDTVLWIRRSTSHKTGSKVPSHIKENLLRGLVWDTGTYETKHENSVKGTDEANRRAPILSKVARPAASAKQTNPKKTVPTQAKIPKNTNSATAKAKGGKK
jgi:hypothetical protein